MIPLTNYDFQWGRSEVVIIYPDCHEVIMACPEDRTGLLSFGEKNRKKEPRMRGATKLASGKLR